jgi:hypothetical protein
LSSYSETRNRWGAVLEAARNGASTDEIAAAIMRSGLSNEQLQQLLTELQNREIVIYER